jgi:uncharacterized membrane protein YedE/YeeE
MFETIRSPWPWYVSGPLIGLMVPILLLAGNKNFGISSSLRHICAACIPARIPFFQYDWKKEAWNLFLVAGIVFGAYLSFFFLRDESAITLHPALINELNNYGIQSGESLVPTELFNWKQLLTIKGQLMMVGGGSLVGFGTRYAGGCTSGHSIMGLSNLQWPSLVATICFMIGGVIMANFILPFILEW